MVPFRVARREERRDLVPQSSDQLAQVLVELYALLQSHADLYVRLLRSSEPLDELLLLVLSLAPSALDLARLLPFAEDLVVGADLRERRRLMM